MVFSPSSLAGSGSATISVTTGSCLGGAALGGAALGVATFGGCDFLALATYLTGSVGVVSLMILAFYTSSLELGGALRPFRSSFSVRESDLAVS